MGIESFDCSATQTLIESCILVVVVGNSLSYGENRECFDVFGFLHRTMFTRFLALVLLSRCSLAIG